MQIELMLNGSKVSSEIEDDMLLLDFLREQGCYSVKRGCETANCGLCTVLLDDKPVLSCGTLAARADGKSVTTIEGVQSLASEFGMFLANEGAEQCGFCSPGFILNVIAMSKELVNPSIEEIKEYLEGNLCRCSGYMGQLRAVQNYLKEKNRTSGQNNAERNYDGSER